MRRILLLGAMLLGIAGTSTGADAACNIRGEFCGYPPWAANAFSHPRDRVPNWVLRDQARRYYGVRRYHHYRYD